MLFEYNSPPQPVQFDEIGVVVDQISFPCGARPAKPSLKIYCKFFPYCSGETYWCNHVS
jgi:hypothetical protein